MNVLYKLIRNIHRYGIYYYIVLSFQNYFLTILKDLNFALLSTDEFNLYLQLDSYLLLDKIC